MKGFVINIEIKTLENEYFREVLYTLYCPAHHKDKTIHKTKEEGEQDTSNNI